MALISDMNQPLGHAVGNALEVKEALATLRGDGPPDFWQHCLTVAAHMLLLAGRAESLAEAEALATAVRDDGRALAKFRAMVVAQGGDGAQVDDPDAATAGAVCDRYRSGSRGHDCGDGHRRIGLDRPCASAAGGSKKAIRSIMRSALCCR